VLIAKINVQRLHGSDAVRLRQPGRSPCTSPTRFQSTQNQTPTPSAAAKIHDEQKKANKTQEALQTEFKTADAAAKAAI
jgi:hypothetical protein